jgi:hypothetical protein
MASRDDATGMPDVHGPDVVRDPLAVPEAVLAARQRPMSERLEVALSWNLVASELRAGLEDSIRVSAPRPALEPDRAAAEIAAMRGAGDVELTTEEILALTRK